MHSPALVKTALRLIEQGENDCAISRRLGIPRSTVREWRIKGKAHLLIREACPHCGDSINRPVNVQPDQYAYLFGLYPGDGYIATHRRGVYRLRITLDRRYPGIVEE